MNKSYIIWIILLMMSCNNENENKNPKVNIHLAIQGSWKGYNEKLIWSIKTDSIYYHLENRSYNYFLHNNDMIVLYKNGPYYLKNIMVKNDTLFFKMDEINAVLTKSKNNHYTDASGKKVLNDSSSDSIRNKIIGEWGYRYKEGMFKFIFTKDSIDYKQSGKKHFYILKDNYIIILMENKPVIMNNIKVHYDTLYFSTPDNKVIKAHRLN